MNDQKAAGNTSTVASETGVSNKKLTGNGFSLSDSNMRSAAISNVALKHSITIRKDSVSATGWGLIVVVVMVLAGAALAIY